MSGTEKVNYMSESYICGLAKSLEGKRKTLPLRYVIRKQFNYIYMLVLGIPMLIIYAGTKKFTRVITN